MKKIEKIEYGSFVANIETLLATFLIPVLWQIYSDRNENIGRSYCTTILGSKTSKVQVFTFLIIIGKTPFLHFHYTQLSSEDEYLAFSLTTQKE